MFKILLLCLMFYIRIVNSVDKSDLDKNLTLNLVQVIFRHGERTPIKEEAKLINITNPTMYGTGFGQLTKRGMMQEYKLGQMLRRNYDEHLGIYNENYVVANTTMTSRTKMSLELVLAGSFPPRPEEKWHPELNWRPIPYTASTIETDIFLAPHQNQKFKDLYNKTVENSEEYNKEMTNYTKFIESLEKWTGYSYFDDILIRACHTWNILKIHKSLNLPLPNWYNEKVYETLENLSGFLLDTLSLTQELQKYNGGPMIRNVIHNIEQNKYNMKKLYLFSTHDLTLAGFTKAQKLTNDFWFPPVGAAYILESYTDLQLQNYIKILSWDGVSDNFSEIEINNCEKYCTVNKYKNAIKDIIPTDEDLKFFDLYTSESLNKFSRIDVIVIVIATIVLTALVFIITVILYKKINSSSFIKTYN